VLEAESCPDVEGIGIEDPEAGNADDVTVYMKGGRRECCQAKYSADARRPATLEWLVESGPGEWSMILGFYKLWKGAEIRPKITLATNRPPGGDPLARLVDGDDGTVARHLEHAKPGSKEGRLRESLEEHLGASKDDTVAFLRDVRFYFRSRGELIDLVKERMHAAKLRNDDGAVDRGVKIVHDWATGGKRAIGRAQLLSAVASLKRPPRSTASLLVQMLDRDPEPSAAVSFDWTGLFAGSEPRRQPSDPGLWNSEFLPAFRRAARTMHSQSHAHVLVRGYARLPTWFAVGAALAEAAYSEVSYLEGREERSSAGETSRIGVECDLSDLGSGRDLAVGVALASDPSPEAVQYIRGQIPGAGKYARIRHPGGASRRAIRDAAEARGWALEACGSIRRLCRRGPERVHLFMSAPRGVALLLGRLWTRMPRTQLYEDLGPGKGYCPSYTFPAS